MATSNPPRIWLLFLFTLIVVVSECSSEDDVEEGKAMSKRKSSEYTAKTLDICKAIRYSASH